MSTNRLEPKIIQIFREGYNFKKFTNDLIAGLIVGIVALPLSLAFAIASGVRPEQGIFTAIIAGFIISFLSGSRVQIGGPTGAFVIIVYNIVHQYGYAGLATATFMSGILLIIMGFAKFGNIIKFIPYPVTVGFTSGIATIIFVSQIPDFFGLSLGKVPAEFIHKITVISAHISEFNFYSIILAVITILFVVYFPKVTKKLPGSLIAIIVTTIIVQIFNLPVETIGSRFGEIPTTLPVPKMPGFSKELIVTMFSPAITIALLAGIESLLSAVVADGMTGFRHRSNMELIAQGVANILSPIFGGIPATGAIARTATNIKNGGRSPVAGIIHAITILLILLFFGKWAMYIPMACLAGILIVVAYNMSEWELFTKLIKIARAEEVLVLLITFLLTVFVDLTVAIKTGVVLAAFLFMRRIAKVSKFGFVTDSLHEEDEEEDDDDVNDPEAISKRKVPDGIEVFEINGPFFFGAADKFKDTLNLVAKKPKVIILRMRHVPVIDATGLYALEDFFVKAKKEGIVIILSKVHINVKHSMEKAGLLKYIQGEHLAIDIDNAIKKAEQILK